MKQTSILRFAALFSLFGTPAIFFFITRATKMHWLWWIMAACLATDAVVFYLILPIAAAGENGFQITLLDAVKIRLSHTPYEKLFEAMAILREAGQEVSPDQLIHAAQKGLDPIEVAREYLRTQHKA